jgi:hypothetical protein
MSDTKTNHALHVSANVVAAALGGVAEWLSKSGYAHLAWIPLVLTAVNYARVALGNFGATS